MTAIPIRVVIVDDQELVRTGLRLLLQQARDIIVVGEAADGAQAISIATTTMPDVMLMDIRMPVMDGIEATRELLRNGVVNKPKVLILTTFDLDEYVYDALHAGASGFLLKDALTPELHAAVRAVHIGDAMTSPTITRRLVSHFTTVNIKSTRALSAGRLAPLTRRERDILALVTRGLSNAEIASWLCLSEGTVKTHVSHVLTKLNLRDRVQAVILGYETGLNESP